MHKLTYNTGHRDYECKYNVISRSVLKTTQLVNRFYLLKCPNFTMRDNSSHGHASNLITYSSTTHRVQPARKQATNYKLTKPKNEPRHLSMYGSELRTYWFLPRKMYFLLVNLENSRRSSHIPLINQLPVLVTTLKMFKIEAVILKQTAYGTKSKRTCFPKYKSCYYTLFQKKQLNTQER